MNWRINLIALPVIFALIAFLAFRADQRVFADIGRLEIAGPVDGVVTLSWEHEVEVPMARRFEEAFARYGDSADTFVIDLNSPGGALVEGREVIEAISRQKATHTIVTRVGPGSVCLSMCVPIFLQGDRRLASPESIWMFHEPSRWDSFTGEQVDGPKFERDRTSRRFFDRYFRDSPIDRAWLENLEREWKGKDVWRKGQELVDEGSGIITALE